MNNFFSTWGYKGTVDDSGTILSDRGVAEDIQSVLDGQRGWKSLVFATGNRYFPPLLTIAVATIQKFECFGCKELVPTENNNYMIDDEEYCSACVQKIHEKKERGSFIFSPS